MQLNTLYIMHFISTNTVDDAANPAENVPQKIINLTVGVCVCMNYKSIRILVPVPVPIPVNTFDRNSTGI